MAVVNRLAQVQRDEVTGDVPVSLGTYQKFLAGLTLIANDPQSEETRLKIIKAVTNSVQVTPTGFKLSFCVGREYVERELVRRASSPSFFMFDGSNSLQNGWRDRD